jgi:hypothetical protein
MTNKIKDNKIDYLITKDNNKLLPWQFYNIFNYISIPMIGKKVLIPEWQKKIETIVPHYLGFNIGLLTGKINNLTVLDIDVKDDGIKFWNIIKKQNPEFITPTVKSPGGSIHFYFKYNSNIPNMNRILINNKKIGWDIKNNNSIIVSPPSIYPDTNKRYKWLLDLSLNDCKPINMPKWLEKFILQHLKQSTIKKMKN